MDWCLFITVGWILSNILSIEYTVQAFRLQLLYFVILCFSNSALIHGLKRKKINCGILWLVFGFMETIALLIYSISHIYACIITHDIKTFAIPLIFLIAAVINVNCWYVVYQYLLSISQKSSQNTHRAHEGEHSHIQIRYKSDGQIDILQDTRGLSPGIYSIAAVHNKDRDPSGSLRNNGEPNELMVYPHPESGRLFRLLNLRKILLYI